MWYLKCLCVCVCWCVFVNVYAKLNFNKWVYCLNFASITQTNIYLSIYLGIYDIYLFICLLMPKVCLNDRSKLSLKFIIGSFSILIYNRVAKKSKLNSFTQIKFFIFEIIFSDWHVFKLILRIPISGVHRVHQGVA